MKVSVQHKNISSWILLVRNSWLQIFTMLYYRRLYIEWIRKLFILSVAKNPVNVCKTFAYKYALTIIVKVKTRPPFFKTAEKIISKSPIAMKSISSSFKTIFLAYFRNKSKAYKSLRLKIKNLSFKKKFNPLTIFFHEFFFSFLLNIKYFLVCLFSHKKTKIW